MKLILDPKFRLWIYVVATAALVVLSAYGIVAGDKLAAWSGLAAAVTGMAAAFTPSGPPPRRALDED